MQVIQLGRYAESIGVNFTSGAKILLLFFQLGVGGCASIRTTFPSTPVGLLLVYLFMAYAFSNIQAGAIPLLIIELYLFLQGIEYDADFYTWQSYFFIL